MSKSIICEDCGAQYGPCKPGCGEPPEGWVAPEEPYFDTTDADEEQFTLYMVDAIFAGVL